MSLHTTATAVYYTEDLRSSVGINFSVSLTDQAEYFPNQHVDFSELYVSPLDMMQAMIYRGKISHLLFKSVHDTFKLKEKS